MTAEAPVLLRVEEGIARLRLNRPDASDALSKPLFTGLIEAVRRLQRDDSVRVVLLSGAGRNFCGGGDAPRPSRRTRRRGVGRSFEEGLPDESRTVSVLGGTADAREGMAAVLERRAPRFGGR